jgi:effector-binding domain-containing protein
MSLDKYGIEYKQVAATQAAYIRFNLRERAEIQALLEEIARVLPAGSQAGPPYLHTLFFSSFTQGWEAEAGFPVDRAVEAGRVRSKALPALEVLALTHHGPPEALRETKLKLYDFTRRQALISDEFARETYPGWPDPQAPVEVQFVIHNWNTLLAHSLERVLGAAGRETVMQGAEALGLESKPEERFEWALGAMGRLDSLADETQKADIISRCAHCFPPSLLEKLRQVYAEARARVEDPLQAVDAVLEFMETDPAWHEKEHRRQGRTVYQTKQPADPAAFAAARSDDEKRAAYCYCPIVRTRLDQGMPVTYCYCGAGWFRQQWETATGRPVRVEVVQSVLKGDPVCEFATFLPEDL